jgi:polyisoprenoid-binding protein YceI
MATWSIDNTHTNVEFTAVHMMFTKVRGKFANVSGTIVYDPQNPTASSVDVSIDAASISTGVDQRDGHLKSPDFLEVEKYPTITFKSTNVSGDAQKAKVTGDLTIHGVTKSVVLDAEFVGQGTNPYGMVVAGFNGTTKINREDFGLTWNVALEAGGILVSKEITINLEVQAVLQQEPVTA